VAEAGRFGDRLDRLVGQRQTPFDLIQAQAHERGVDGLAQHAVHMFFQFVARLAERRGDVIDPDAAVQVVAEELQHGSDQRVGVGQAVGAGPQFDPARRNQPRCLGRRLAGHQPVQQGGALVAHAGQVVAHAGERHADVLADQRVVVDTQDGDVVGHGKPRLQAGRFDFRRIVVAIAKNGQGLGQGLQLAFQPPVLRLPVVGVAAAAMLPDQKPRRVARLCLKTLRKAGTAQGVGVLVFRGEVSGAVKAALAQVIRGDNADLAVVTADAGQRDVHAERAHVHARHALAADVADHVGAAVQQGDDAVAGPALRQAAAVVDRQVPVFLCRITSDPFAQTMVIPLHQNQNIRVFHAVIVQRRIGADNPE